MNAPACHRLLVVFAIAALPLAGCGKKEPDQPPPRSSGQQTTPPKSAGDSAAAGAVPTTAQAQADLIAPNVNHEVTAAMHRFLEQKGALPERLDQLVAGGFLKRLPAPPHGKTLVINTNNLQVEIVDK